MDMMIQDSLSIREQLKINTLAQLLKLQWPDAFIVQDVLGLMKLLLVNLVLAKWEEEKQMKLVLMLKI